MLVLAACGGDGEGADDLEGEALFAQTTLEVPSVGGDVLTDAQVTAPVEYLLTLRG